MAIYGVAEAKNRFTHLLEQAERGEPVTITRHGKPIAELRATAPKARQLSPEERRARHAEFVAEREQGPVMAYSAADVIRSMRDGDPE